MIRDVIQCVCVCLLRLSNAPVRFHIVQNKTVSVDIERMKQGGLSSSGSLQTLAILYNVYATYCKHMGYYT